MEFFQPDTTKYCPKCSMVNPKDGRFCFECGNPFEADKQQLRQCSTCGITIDSSRLFCPNCSQSLIEKPLDYAKTEQEPILPKESFIECPACGQLTIGDYCRNCGYNLLIYHQKRPIDWWYCDRDSAIMTEINPNLQILVSRTSLDESLSKAITKNILQQQDREKAKLISLQLFKNGSQTNFEVLSQVRCPVCGHQSLAPTTHHPPQLGFKIPREITLNASSILQNGIYYLRTYPQLFLIFLFGMITDGGLILLGLNTGYIYDPSSILSGLFSPFSYRSAEQIVYSFSSLIILTIISFVMNIFFQCWYYNSLKEINRETPFNIGKSFKGSLKFLPKALIAQLLILGIILALAFGFIFILLFLSGLILSPIWSYNSSYLMLLVFSFLVLFAVFGAVIVILLISILFTYVNMSIVFDDESGVILSLRRSWRFTRRYFWTTLGIIFIFSIGSYFIGYIEILFSSSLYFLFSSGLITSIIYVISNRLLEAYRTVSLGWAYDGFKHTIE